MISEHGPTVTALLGAGIPAQSVSQALTVLTPMIGSDVQSSDSVDAATLAAALNVALFADLVERAPTGAAYVNDVRKADGRVCFDHGAIRTVRMPNGGTGKLPAGELAFRRLLEPLGYEEAAIYPLPALRMTGRAFRHRLYPETLPQFFVSELHVDQFEVGFGDAAQRVFGSSKDPIKPPTCDALELLASGGALQLRDAVPVLRALLAAFGRHHERPTLADYEILKRHSNEAAWIATEGNAFNHATDRVADVEALSRTQQALGRPIKDRVEHSASGRVKQTAYLADSVERRFGLPGARDTTLSVPGSFYEFISRDIDPATGRIDLSFDSANATGIFGMTKSA